MLRLDLDAAKATTKRTAQGEKLLQVTNQRQIHMYCT